MYIGRLCVGEGIKEIRMLSTEVVVVALNESERKEWRGEKGRFI